MDTPAPEEGRKQDASPAGNPFRVEDDAPRARAEPDAPTSGPRDAPETGASPTLPRRSLLVPRPSAEASGVSAETVRERTDPGSATVAGPIAPPPGWPKEMWKFPVRGLGFLRLGLVTAVFASVDALCEWNAFVGWVVKLVALFYLVRLEIRTVSGSASGRDEMPSVGLDGTWDEFMRPALGFLGVAGLLTAPAILSWVLPRIMPMLAKDPSWALFAALVAAPLLYLPVVMLGQALGDLSMKWPHRALPWVFRGFSACLLVGAGWAVLGLVEWALAATNGTSSFGLLLHIVLRAGSLYLMAVGARALGVLGRRYGPA